ncbi:MAG: YdeI/OmpD-associated family protein [Candidatus Sericytochromatia bacterium]
MTRLLGNPALTPKFLGKTNIGGHEIAVLEFLNVNTFDQRITRALLGIEAPSDKLIKMNKASHNNKNGGPAVLRFKAEIFWQPETAKTTTAAMLTIPAAVSKQLCDMTKVEGTINGHPFRASLEIDASGDHSLRVNKAMLKGAGANAGDTVALAILGPEPAPTIPADLLAPLDASEEAMTLWEDLTPLGRRDWIRWIEAARTPETRARRVMRTVEQLSEGKRRPCCVNVYEFMLCRIQETQ